jgi:hypothetical protein
MSSFYDVELYPSTIISDGSVGTIAWTNPGNAGADDSVYAEATAWSESTVHSHYLKCTNFGFNIPSLADVYFVRVKFNGHYTRSGAGWVKDNSVRLVVGGVIQSYDAAREDTLNLNTDADNLFDFSVSYTYDQVNASDFGVVYQTKLWSYVDVDWVKARADAISIRVYYEMTSRGLFSVFD